MLVFKLLIRSLLVYVAPNWFPNTGLTSMNKLRVIQNFAIRIATGSMKKAAIDHFTPKSKFVWLGYTSEYSAQNSWPLDPTRASIIPNSNG